MISSQNPRQVNGEVGKGRKTLKRSKIRKLMAKSLLSRLWLPSQLPSRAAREPRGLRRATRRRRTRAPWRRRRRRPWSCPGSRWLRWRKCRWPWWHRAASPCSRTARRTRIRPPWGIAPRPRPPPPPPRRTGGARAGWARGPGVAPSIRTTHGGLQQARQSDLHSEGDCVTCACNKGGSGKSACRSPGLHSK